MLQITVEGRLDFLGSEVVNTWCNKGKNLGKIDIENISGWGGILDEKGELEWMTLIS